MRRKTKEVEIKFDLGGKLEVQTGDKVLDHLLETLLFYMERSGKVSASWDLRHHLWEDSGILFGKVLKEKIKGIDIARYGSALVPMEDALVLASVDVSRTYLNFELEPEKQEEGFSPNLAREFLLGLVRSLEATLHLLQLRGQNSHHVIEAGFKSLGVAMSEALGSSERLESTKGRL